jgi:uncharacterized membrane protein
LVRRIFHGLSRAFELVDEVAARASLAATSWIIGPLIIAVTLGSTLWPLRHRDRLDELLTNKLATEERRSALLYVVGALVVILTVYAAAVVIRRLVRGEWRVAATADWLTRRFAWLAAAPAILMMSHKGIEKESPKLVLALAVVTATLVGFSVYAWRSVAKRDEDAEEHLALTIARRFAPALVLVGVWALYAWFFARMAVTNHHALNTRIADLGYYDNIFYQSIHGRFLGCSFMKGGYHYAGHFDPILVLLSPLYLLYPRAEMLLVFQPIWLASGVVPVYLIGRHYALSRPISVLLALCFALYPPLHGANMYEFHSLTLIVPLVLWLLWFLIERRWVGYAATAAALLLCREDVSLLLCFVGFYALRSGAPRAGWATIAVSLAYFALVKKFIMGSTDMLNQGDESISFAYYYADLIPNKTGAAELVTSVLTNPAFVVKHVLDEPKVMFVALLFAPLMFMPLLSRPGRLMLVYGLTFCLLATRAAVFSIHFQYACAIFPIAFALVPHVLRVVPEAPWAAAAGRDPVRLRRAAAAAMLVCTALCSWKFGGIVENSSFRGGFVRIVRTLNDGHRANYRWVRQQVAAIPRNARVAASGKMGPHISNRREAYFYPSRVRIDYALLDESELKAAELDAHNKRVSSGKLVEVARHNKLVLLKRSE